jgi:hypothetical protein
MSSLAKLRNSLCGTAAVAFGLIGLTVGSASAGVLTPFEASTLGAFTYSSYSVVNNTNVTISGSPLVGQSGTFGSGQIDLRISSGAFTGDDLATWCIDVFDDLQGSGAYSIISQPLPNDGGNHGGPNLSNPVLAQIGALVHWGDLHINDASWVSAAVQLAIWSLEYTTDSFVSSDPAVNSHIGYVETQAGTSFDINSLREVVDADNQGLIFEIAGSANAPSPAPLPSTWTMMLIGLAGFGFFAVPRTKRRGIIPA